MQSGGEKEKRKGRKDREQDLRSKKERERERERDFNIALDARLTSNFFGNDAARIELIGQHCQLSFFCSMSDIEIRSLSCRINGA